MKRNTFCPRITCFGVFAGKHDQDWAYDRVDSEGKRFGDELKRIGWLGDEKVGARKCTLCLSYILSKAPF